MFKIKYNASIIGILIFSWKASALSFFHLSAKESSDTPGISVTASWVATSTDVSLSLSWDAVIYTSEVNYNYVGRGHIEAEQTKYVVSKDLKFDQQYRFCMQEAHQSCQKEETHCLFIKVTKPSRNLQASHRYMVLGPVHSSNLTIAWSSFMSETENKLKDRSYRLSWRKIDGRVGGHPGHSSNVVSNTHYIKGILPATRYEICVGETVERKELDVCDIITTAEDVAGPPKAQIGRCSIQARGTHWRCEIDWKSPKKPNGKIRGYKISWKDEEGYSLIENNPTGTVCDPYCTNFQILPFHPSEICIRARTSKGYGWESCVEVKDVQERILAFFEFKVFMIIISTAFFIKFGFDILRWIFKTCVRFLYSSMNENQKEHPV